MSCAAASSSGEDAHVSSWFDDLSKIADAGGGRCFVLMQRFPRAGNDADAFDSLCASAGVVAKSVALPKLPLEFHPLLLQLELGESLHWQILDAIRSFINQDHDLDGLNRGCVQRVCAFIFSNGSAENIERAIRSSAIVRPPKSGRYRWLRFYDPIVGLVFWPLLGQEQRRGLLSGIASWCFVDPWGKLHVMAGEPAQPVSTNHYSLRLTQGQWSRLAGVGSLHQAWLRASRKELPADRKAFNEAAAALFIAQARGLHSRLELDYFAWQVFQYGPRILNHPKVEQMFQEIDSDHDYIGLAHEIDVDEWRLIGEEAKKMHLITRNVTL